MPQGADDKFFENIELPLLARFYEMGATALIGDTAEWLAGLFGGFEEIIKKGLGDTGAESCNGPVFADIRGSPGRNWPA